MLQNLGMPLIYFNPKLYRNKSLSGFSFVYFISDKVSCEIIKNVPIFVTCSSKM